jgi:hypothetical protein
MSCSEERHFPGERGWESVGRAAENLARRLARDASRFAERMAEHASEFASDVVREHHRTRRDLRHELRRAAKHMSGNDVRRVFEDIRSVVADVLDGVDELIERVFEGGDETRDTAADAGWVHLVHNRDATCSGCGRPIRAGDDGWARRTAEGTDARCAACGNPERTEGEPAGA